MARLCGRSLRIIAHLGCFGRLSSWNSLRGGRDCSATGVLRAACSCARAHPGGGRMGARVRAPEHAQIARQFSHFQKRALEFLLCVLLELHCSSCFCQGSRELCRHLLLGCLKAFQPGARLRDIPTHSIIFLCECLIVADCSARFCVHIHNISALAYVLEHGGPVFCELLEHLLRADLRARRRRERRRARVLAHAKH